jgi:hypothetical protein
MHLKPPLIVSRLDRASECSAEIIAQLFPFARVDRPRLVVTCFGNATKIFHRVRDQIVVASGKQTELMKKAG